MPALLAASALGLGACGGTAPEPVAAPLPEAGGPVAAAPATPTDGRLGDATTTAGRGGERVLSRGGRARLDAGVPPRGVREGVDGAAGCGAVEADPVAETLPDIAASTLCLLNAERSSRGLAPLAANARLAAAAVAQSRDMVARKYFAHRSPSGSTPVARIRAAGYIPADRSWTVGENLAWGTGALATPAAIVRAWMASPGHRDNILKPAYREIGLGIVVGTPKAGLDGGATYATTFGAVSGGAIATAPVSRPAAAKRAPARAKATKAERRPRTAAGRRAARARARAAAVKRAKARAARARAARR